MARRYYKVTRLPSGHDIGNRFLSGISRVYLDKAGNISIGEKTEWIIGKMDTYTTYVSYSTPVAYMSSDGLRLYIANHSYSISTGQHLSKLWGKRQYGWEETGRAWWQRNSYWSSDGRIEFLEYKRSAADRDKAEAEMARREGFAEVSYEDQCDYYAERGSRPKRRIGLPKNVTWYKVVDPDLCAQNGGTYQYVMGEWTEKISQPVLCFSGYHVTDVPRKWMKPNSRILTLEVKGFVEYDRSSRKAVFQSIRPVGEIPYDEAMNIS